MYRLLLYVAVVLLPGCFCSELPQSVVDECDYAAMHVSWVKLGLSSFARKEKRFPDSLDELVKHGHIGSGDLRDVWGEALSYRRLPEEYELFSNGPDRLPMTDDDVFGDISHWGCAVGEEDRYLSWNCSGPFVLP